MLSILLFILELIIIPYLLGVVIVRKKDFCLRLLIGFSSYMALFFILYFIGIGCSMRLHELMTIFMTAVGSVIIAFFLCRFFVSKKNGETFSIVSELKSDDYSSFKNFYVFRKICKDYYHCCNFTSAVSSLPDDICISIH